MSALTSVTWIHNGGPVAIAYRDRLPPHMTGDQFKFKVCGATPDTVYEGTSPSMAKAIDSVRILLQIYCGLKEERGQDDKAERKLIDK